MSALFSTDDTIAAIASARGGAPRGIVRITGPKTIDVVARRWRSADTLPLLELQQNRVLSGEVDVGGSIGCVACDLYVWPTSRSYTQQPSIEIHTVGSPPILDALLRTLCEDDIRLAEPGEFTMRAFLAGRLDLTQAEAVLGVIDADSQRELDVALKQLAGGIGSPLNALRDTLLNLLAHLEAGLDFVEEDIEFISVEELTSQLHGLRSQLQSIVKQMQSRSRGDDEIRVVLRGLPNAGKSSLLNALVHDEAAIVSDVAGTTRDYITRRLEMKGVSFLMIDTAGVEADPNSAIDDAAQALGRSQHADAEIELLCIDVARPLDDWERIELSKNASHPCIVVLTKVDLASEYVPLAERDVGVKEPLGKRYLINANEGGSLPSIDDAVRTSAETNQGIEELRRRLVDVVVAVGGSESSVVSSTSVRCRESLFAAAASLDNAIECATASLGEELVAAELRRTLDELGKVVGVIYTDDILDRIFSTFCIGK